jgi:arsenite methyltransferase
MSCCAKKSVEENIHDDVRKYYGEVLSQTKDLKTSACTSAEKPHKMIRDTLQMIPQKIIEKFYGCGTPIPLGIKGCNVLDLGSGSGRDCYIAANIVGQEGNVIGVDMTDQQLQVANEHVQEYMTKLKYNRTNLRFVKGYIEELQKLDIEPGTIDLVISNCVVNLSPNKKAVLEGVYHLLKEGGEFYFSDVYCDRRLSQEVRQHKVLYGECISGALYVNDFIRLCHQVGFLDPRIISQTEITVEDEELRDITGNAKFYSITYRLFKLNSLETLCEDYGQYAVYLGNIPGLKWSYKLDDHHEFETNKPTLVCGNTASMLSETWLKPYFKVVGTREVHYGLFPCDDKSGSKNEKAQEKKIGGCC